MWCKCGQRPPEVNSELCHICSLNLTQTNDTYSDKDIKYDVLEHDAALIRAGKFALIVFGLIFTVGFIAGWVMHVILG